MHIPTPGPVSRPLFWTLGLSLVAVEGLAFWLVCDHQVDRAQARRVQSQAEQLAYTKRRMAELIAHPGVQAVRLSSCKPDVYPDCEGVGVEIIRIKSAPC